MPYRRNTSAAVATVMLRCRWHTYQVLTKRADRLQHLLATKLRAAAAAPHIWWGVSVENKKHGVPRIDYLRQTRAGVRFLSIEPLLEDLGRIDLSGIDWVIVGGESGNGSRPMRADWLYNIKEQCDQQGTLFFFKQWGGVRKATAGRSLNGKTYDAMPPRSPTPVPDRSGRQKLGDELAALIGDWQATPLLQLHASPGLL